MAEATKRIDPEWAWQTYSPDEKNPWDIRKAGHLLRRTQFGGTSEDLEGTFKAGVSKAIEQLLTGKPNVDEFDARMAPLAQNIARTNNAANLRAWWLTRMLYSPHPFQEKMTLFWHNHFATSNAKVQNAQLMLTQYALLRKHALGNFGSLLREMSYDPAMIIWLDGRGSKKGNPNENYARELMELFSLGIGNYTEMDIREAARAFTGWAIEADAAKFTAKQFDAGEKVVLKVKGNHKPDDIVKIMLDQPACSEFLCRKLFVFLVSDTLLAEMKPEQAKQLLAPLAAEFKKSGYDFAALVKRVISSNLFFSEHAYRTKIKSPVDFTLGIVRGLEGRIGTTELARSLEQLGQNLFNPPSVKGWDGGQAWLNGQTLLYRQNLALAFCSTEDSRFGTRIDPAALAKKHKKSSDEELVEFFVRLFLQGDVAAESKDRLVEYAKKSQTVKVPVYWTAEDASDQRVRTLCHLVLTLPEFQLD
jgi:uncharacterized protein (DUF1800 family)